MATRLVPPPAAQHPNMPPYVAGDAQFPKDVAVSGRSNRPLTTKARATLARPDRTLPASAKSRYKEDERSDNEIGLTEENSAWHALNSRQAVLLPETCVGHIDRGVVGPTRGTIMNGPATDDSSQGRRHHRPRGRMRGYVASQCAGRKCSLPGRTVRRGRCPSLKGAKSMILFETDSQWREKAMIWRLFAMLPLSSFLLNDHIVRWFAVNIPMSLVQGGGHGELDIIAKLKYPPRSKDTWFYRTWEVKVSLLCNDGTAKSLKAGKLPGVLTQMRNYRRFGASSVTLLDLYLCQVARSTAVASSAIRYRTSSRKSELSWPRRATATKSFHLSTISGMVATTA